MNRKAELAGKLSEARKKTLWLLDQVPLEFFNQRIHDFYSPVGWHFGHIGRTEEYWIWCHSLGRPPADERLSFLFADLPENPKDNRVHLPSIDEIVGYLAMTREKTLSALDEADLDSLNPYFTDGYAWEFALQHECQHQETICELLQLIWQKSSEPPLQVARLGEGAGGEIRGLSPFERSKDKDLGALVPGEDVDIPGGICTMGSNDPHGYDNEKPAHEVEVAPFAISRCPVTAGQWGEFMADGGYETRRLWTAEGWEWRMMAGATRPEYWVDGLKMWTPQGLRTIHLDEPVSSVSWYEADAYCRWAGRRLPSETEWEYACGGGLFPWGDETPDEARAEFGIHAWSPTPVRRHAAGRSKFGVEDLGGNVWEWTATPFLPYPGFQAFPYDGYSKDHMDGRHFVCRGGSWATAAPILRKTFRNWYVPSYRQGFLGLRTARL